METRQKKIKTIAILFHEFREFPEAYTVHYLADFWREAGIEVIYLFGTRRFVPADLLLVHVNLSVVPPNYLKFAQRYPRVLNQKVTDIRKSSYSSLLLGPDDSWTGPVIVKSDRNFGGIPERRIGSSWLEQRWALARRIRAAIERRVMRNHPFASSSTYRVLPRLSEVSSRWFSAKDVVVEKFLPEMQNGLFHLRMYQVLGDRWTCTRLASHEPVVKASNSVSAVDVTPHPIVDQWKRDIGLDYGKFDYVVVDGEPILIDVNKTTGSSPGYMETEELRERRRHLAYGIYSFVR